MPGTRDQIIEYLRLHPLARAGEIAQALQVTPANVRHHLTQLRRAGLVEVAGVDPTPKRGRPAQRYRLTSAAQSADLAPLVRALLAVLRQSEGGLETHFAALGRALIPDPPLPLEGNLRQRIQRLVALLSELGYEAHWEAHHQGPLILLRRCPFALLREDFPELCRFDHYLIEHALGRPVEWIQSAAQPPEGGLAVCRYLVRWH